MAPRGNQLRLHEELVLIALEDHDGTFRWKSYGYTVGGALVAELLLEKRIGLERDHEGRTEKNPLVELLDDEPLGCPVLDGALERIATAKRRARVGDWVTRLANRRGVQHEIARELCRRGILREDEKSVLLFFKRKVFPEVNPVPERKLLQRLERAIFGEGAVDERTAILVSLADAGKLLQIPFEKGRLKRRRDRIESLREGRRVAESTRQVIEQMDVVMTTVVITAAT